MLHSGTAEGLKGQTSFIELVYGHLTDYKHPAGTNEEHLRAVMVWLCSAQDATGCGGVAAAYYPYVGWAPPYPEVTGYIIPTFLHYAAFSGDGRYIERAIGMGEWELSIQMPDGAVRGGWGINDYPLVFDTGQVIFGWLSLFEKTGREEFLAAAVHAADWLADCQDADGKWSRFVYKKIATTYHTRVAWPLLLVYRRTGDPRHRDAAERHLRWTLDQVHEDGWIDNMGFTQSRPPFTHTIAYTLEGLLESSHSVPEPLAGRIRATVRRACDAIMESYNRHYPLPMPGTFSRGWRPSHRYTCVTGDAQMAILFLRLYQLFGSPQYSDVADRLLQQIKEVQCRTCADAGIRGGLPGSCPIWGRYRRFSYPNCGPKFFADALMLRESIVQNRCIDPVYRPFHGAPSAAGF
ncbi:hypothetical protein [Methanoculleus frigidifontis]|nr:hypothetical protein [Methanoculleus sp. FWC-SCC1]